MERLSDRAIEIINDLHTERLDYTSEYIPLIEAAQKLAAYEDAALEPDRIAEIIWRLWDYFDADREGRLIVLPCEDRIDRENLANRIERMVVRDDCLIGVSSGEKKLAYAITSALRSEE